MSVYDFFLAVTTLGFLVVAAVMGWGIVRRRKMNAESGNLPDRESVGRELLWWALPTLLMLLLFVLTIVGAMRG
jgi:heme/copper-type cytochrome/quinol oxidase subunit 2